MKKFLAVALIVFTAGIGIDVGIHELIYRTRDIAFVREVYTVKKYDNI